MISILPDVNVWLAMAYEGHIHHARARKWFEELGDEQTLCFCRITQMSLLRLLTNRAAVGSGCLTQKQAWAGYDRLVLDPRVVLIPEPPHLEAAFRRTSARDTASQQHWTDDYLLALAISSNLTLVTFDRAFAARTSNSLLL